jgi:hypothetical protein
LGVTEDSNLLHFDIQAVFQIADGHPDGFIGGRLKNPGPERCKGLKLSRRQLRIPVKKRAKVTHCQAHVACGLGELRINERGLTCQYNTGSKRSTSPLKSIEIMVFSRPTDLGVVLESMILLGITLNLVCEDAPSTGVSLVSNRLLFKPSVSWMIWNSAIP